MVEIVGVDCSWLDLGETHPRLHVVGSCVVQVGHRCHRVHGGGHGGRRDGLWFLYPRLLKGGVVGVVNMREDECPLHCSSDLLRRLRESLIAVAPTHWVALVTGPSLSLFLVVEVPTEHALAGGDEGEPVGLELRGEQRGEDGGGTRVVGGETAMVGLSHVLLGAGME